MKLRQKFVLVALALSLLFNVAVALRKGGPRRERVAAGATVAGAGVETALPAASAIDGPITKATIAELRAQGVEEEIVTCLALAAGQIAFRGRIAELYFPEGRPFWKQGRAHEADVRPLEKERDRAVEELLGHASRATVDLMTMERAARLEGVPERKIAEVERLEADYRKVREMKEGTGWTDQERLIVNEFEADLAKVLDPAELRGYLLRNSPTAIHLAQELGEAPVTEEEFGRLWEIKRSADLGSDRISQPELLVRYQSALPPEKFRAVLASAVPGFAALTQGGGEAEDWTDAWKILQTDADAIARGNLRPATREALVVRFGEATVGRYEAAARAGRRR